MVLNREMQGVREWNRDANNVESISSERERVHEKSEPLSCDGKRSKQFEHMRQLLGLPLHIIDDIIANLCLTDLLVFRRCSKQTRDIVDRYFYVQKSLVVRVKEMHRLFPHLDPSQEQFKSIYHIRRELGKLFLVLPKNRLLALDFSGVRRFQSDIVVKIINESGTYMHSVFSNVTSLSFAGCLLSSYDLLLVSLCTQKLRFLTLTDRLMNHNLSEEDIDPSRIRNFYFLEKRRLIGYRRKIISYVKTLWPTLQYLTFA